MKVLLRSEEGFAVWNLPLMEWAQSGTKCEYYGKEGSYVEINRHVRTHGLKRVESPIGFDCPDCSNPN